MSYNNTIINITRQEDAWNYFTPNENEVYRINKFDDGNSKLINYINKWLIYGKWRGKYALINCANPAIRVESISTWKVEQIML